MSKAYLVANIRVKDRERFKQFFVMAGPAIKKYVGKVLACGSVLPDLRAILVVSR